MPRDGVFISHAHGDGDLAGPLTELVQKSLGLDDSRITCTSDERYGLASGQPLKDQIEKHLESAAVVILVSSPRTEGREWVSFECGYASGQHVPLHVVIPSEEDRHTVPEPYRGNISVTLSRGPEVIGFARDLAAELGVASGPKVSVESLARLVEAARKREVDSLNAAARARIETVENERGEAVRTAAQQQKLALALAAVAVLLTAGAVWWARGQSTEVAARSESECERKLSEETRKMNEAYDREVRRFSLHGKLTLRGAPLSGAELAIFRRFAAEQSPIATDRTDHRGEYSFKEGDLGDIDPKEKIDLVVKHARLQGQNKLAKVSPQEARLDIDLE